MAIYINTVNGSVNDIHDNTVNINVNNGSNPAEKAEDIPCTDLTKASEDGEPEQQPATENTKPEPETQLPDSPVFLENKLKGITLEISKSKVNSVFCSSGSKKEVLEELFLYHGRYVNLFNLGQEARLAWLNSIPSNFQGKFNKYDLKYYHETDDDPHRRTRS